MFGFEGELAKDLKDYEKRSGKNYITLSVKFSKGKNRNTMRSITSDYPHKPPFVRVVEPRFQFRTGHGVSLAPSTPSNVQLP